MRAVLGFLLLLLSGPVFSVALRGDNKPTPKNTLSPAFQQLKKQTPTDTASAATTTDSTTASAAPTTEQPTATAADQAATTSTPTTTATDTPTSTPTTTTDTPATTDTGGSVAETTATASNADLEAEQAKLNSIKDQIAEEQVKLDAIHASTLVTNPEMSGTKQYTDTMSNEQVDDLAKQVLTMPNLQAEDDKAKAASCAAPAAGATGAGGAAAGGAAAATAAAGGDAAAAAATATDGGAAAGAGASDAEIMKKHQEFSTLIKHAQESIDEISAMPYLGQDSNKEAAALTCGAPAPTDTPKTEGDAAAAAASSAAAAAPAAPTAAAAPAAATAAPAPATGATGATGTASA